MSQPTSNLPPLSGENPSGLQPGQRVADGRFMLRTLLGRGGMAEVWLAVDENLAEKPALKFLTGLKDDPQAVEDLRRETQKCRQLSHPNIVRIHDFHIFPGEPPFISMEFVDGVTLDVARRQQSSRVLTWKFLEPLVQQLCGALQYAHGEQVIHRDLKPANLLVDGKGRLKLGDFGIAAQASERRPQGGVRHASSGTPPYMSPQQIRGEPARVTDDVYALGATLYELLTSKPPFYLGDPVYQALNVAPQTIDDRLADFDIQNPIPPAVRKTIMACLSKEAAQRPQSAAAVAKLIAGDVGQLAGVEAPGQLIGLAKKKAEHSAAGGEKIASKPESRSDAPELDERLLGATERGSAFRKWFSLATLVVVFGLVAGLTIKLSSRQQAGRSTITPDNPAQAITNLSVPVAETTSGEMKSPTLLPLKLYWNSDSTVAISVASPAGESQADTRGYRLSDVQGRLFATQQPDTVPLKLFYGEKRKDFMLVTSAQARIDAETAQYSLVGIEGYVYDTPHPGTIPLKLFWSGKLRHHLSVASAEAEALAKAASYGFVRNEGYIFPANMSASSRGAIPSVLASGITWDEIRRKAATIEVEKMKPMPLVPGTGKNVMTQVPAQFLQFETTVHVPDGKSDGGVNYEVKSDGYLLLACNFDNQGNSGGGWQAERWKKSDFIAHGWQEISVAEVGGVLVYGDLRSQILFLKQVAKGERGRLRCNKYTPPFFIVPSAVPAQ